MADRVSKTTADPMDKRPAQMLGVGILIGIWIGGVLYRFCETLGQLLALWSVKHGW